MENTASESVPLENPSGSLGISSGGQKCLRRWIEYEDGTPATTSQMAKDVVEFLNWAAEPEMDERKKMGMKALALSAGLFAISVWVKRYKWAAIKARKIVYNPPVRR